MATLFISLLLLLLLSTSIAHSSDSDSLHRLISSLGGQQLLVYNNPCLTPGVTCSSSSSLRATRIHLPSRRLAGSISPSIGSLSELRHLDLSSNLLSGPVPSQLSSLLSLRHLDLSSNRLTGDLRFLTHFPNLENLSLAGNLFSGPVPRSLSSFRNLLLLDLSGNPGLVGHNPPLKLTSRNSMITPDSKFSLRRSLVTSSPHNNSHRNTSYSISFAPAPAPAASILHRHHKRHKHRVRNLAIGLFSGAIAGIASGILLSALFRLTVNCIRRRYRRYPGGASIFSPIIKRAEDIAFLAKDDGVAGLEVIGRGGSGEVYKAVLPYDPPRTLAIKKVMKRSTESAEPTEEESRLLDKWMRQIRSEIMTVGRIRHRNLLPLLAHQARPDCHFLVYEFMKNGSVHEALKDAASGSRELGWLARHNIALGVAAGLEHLHIHHKPHIIHRDLKPANILLDDDMEARIADFGLAKELQDANTHMTTSNVAGTVGYIAPEYHQTLRFTAKCDIYSFGVILAGLVLGRSPSDDFFQDTDEMSLVKWLRNVMASADAGQAAAAIDPRLRGRYEEQMLLVLRIACFCTADEPKDRPNSKEVRLMLSQIKH